MIKKILKYVFPFTILIGTMLIAFGLTSFNNATVITNDSISYGNFTWSFYKFNLNLYLKNLEYSLQTNNLTGIIQNPPELPTTPNSADVIAWVKFIANILLIYIANWMIYAFNYLILAPIKILIYPLNIVLTIMGLNTTNNDYINILTKIYNWQLPYIPQIG